MSSAARASRAPQGKAVAERRERRYRDAKHKGGERRMAVVTIRDLRKSFGTVEVLHGVSIDIAEGEFVVLVGPSGCGKSTLLRMLAGLEHVTSGEIRIGERVVDDLPPKERDIAMVFQNYALYPHLTVAENMAFSLTLKGAPKAEITARVKPAAEILGLSNLLDRYPQRVRQTNNATYGGALPYNFINPIGVNGAYFYGRLLYTF